MTFGKSFQYLLGNGSYQYNILYKLQQLLYSMIISSGLKKGMIIVIAL